MKEKELCVDCHSRETEDDLCDHCFEKMVVGEWVAFPKIATPKAGNEND
jgi:hypothetical protein